MPKTGSFQPDMANYGGRHSIVKQHHAHASSIARIRHVVETGPPTSYRTSRKKRGSPTFPASDTHGSYNARKVTSSHWVLEDRSPPPSPLRLPKAGSKPGYREILSSSSSLFSTARPRTAGDSSSSPGSPASTLGTRTSSVQAYIDFGVQNGGMAQSFLDARQKQRPVLRVFRHQFPEEFNQVYVQFLSMLSMMEKRTMMEVVDDVWRDATENRNRPWVLDSYKSAHSSATAPRPEAGLESAESKSAEPTTGGGSPSSEAPFVRDTVSLDSPVDRTKSDYSPPKVIKGSTKRAEVFCSRVARGDFEPEELLELCNHSVEPSVRDAVLRQTYGKYKLLTTVFDFSSKVSSELDLQTAMEMIVGETCEVLDCERASLFIVDHHTNEMWSKVAEGAPEIRFPMGTGIVGAVADSGVTISIPDAYNDSRFNQEVDRKSGYRTKSILCFPIKRKIALKGRKKATFKHVVVAVLEAINKREGGAFTAQDEAVMDNLGGQAASVLNNALSHKNSQLEKQKVKALLHVSERLSQQQDLDSTLGCVMENAQRLTKADRCTVYLRDGDDLVCRNMSNSSWGNERKEPSNEHRNSFEHARQLLSSRDIEASEPQHGHDGEKEFRFPIGVGIAGTVAKTRRNINILNAYKDARFNPEHDKLTGYSTRSILCCPILNHEGSLVGVVQLINKMDQSGYAATIDLLGFTKDDEALLRAFTQQAGVAIESAQMYNKALSTKNYLDSILQSINSVVMTLDKRGRLKEVNRIRDVERIFGCDVSDLKSASFRLWLRRSSEGGKLMNDGHRMLLDDIETMLAGDGKSLHREDMEFMSRQGQVFTINYSVNLLLHSTDKGVEKHVVVTMADVTKEKRTKQTLARYMSPELASLVLQDGGEKLGGVRVEATVLFSDIRSFTSLSEELDAGQVVEMLNEFFTEMVAVVLDQHGILDKFIGDAMMCVFGIPFAKGDDAKRACSAALLMNSALKQYNVKRASQGKKGIRVGIGLNTGPVISGNIGSAKRMEYTVIGDHVNLASRLEGASKKYGVTTIISEFTYGKIKDDGFVCRINVVGKTEPVGIYELVAFGETQLSRQETDGLKMFEEGLSLYRSRRWDDARTKFEEAATQCSDQPSMIFAERCIRFQREPPPDSWDGVYTMSTK